MKPKVSRTSPAGEPDLFGRALWDYVNGRPRDMITWTSLSPPEILRTAYLFRSFDEMPAHEQLALQLSRGRILDVGAGSGSHSLWLQNLGRDVTALDVSRYACRTMEKRGVRRRIWSDLWEYRPDILFDTVLLMMNGAGIVGRARNLPRLMEYLRQILTPGGQVLIHSSDIDYLYTLYDLPLPSDGYYGDVTFYLKYGENCTHFPWTYPDPDLLAAHARRAGFQVRTRYEDADVLLQLILKSKAF